MRNKTIDDLKELLSYQRISKSDIINLMTQTRRLLEVNNKKNDYPILNFFCNWSLHSKLSNSTICYQILEKLTDMLISYDDRTDLTLNVSSILSTNTLRGQFLAFFGENNLQTAHFVIDENWKNLFMLISSNLLERPIEFPKSKILSKAKFNNVKKIYDSIIAKSVAITTDDKYAVRRFMFIEENGKLHWNLNTNSDFVNIRSIVYLN